MQQLGIGRDEDEFFGVRPLRDTDDLVAGLEGDDLEIGFRRVAAGRHAFDDPGCGGERDRLFRRQRDEPEHAFLLVGKTEVVADAGAGGELHRVTRHRRQIDGRELDEASARGDRAELSPHRGSDRGEDGVVPGAPPATRRDLATLDPQPCGRSSRARRASDHRRSREPDRPWPPLDAAPGWKRWTPSPRSAACGAGYRNGRRPRPIRRRLGCAREKGRRAASRVRRSRARSLSRSVSSSMRENFVRRRSCSSRM